MGVDCYGLEPHNPNQFVKPTINWDDDPSERERQKFFNETEVYEKQVKGSYFRNNWWYWRPMWAYATTIGLEHGIITKGQAEYGNGNDGSQIDGETAKKWGELILWDIAEGNVRDHETEYKIQYDMAKEHNDELDKAMQILREVVQDETGNKDIVPNDYPKKHKKSWQELWDKRDHRASYPFSEENLKEFAEFMVESGGFSIC